MTQDTAKKISGVALPNDMLLPWLWPFYILQQFSRSKVIGGVTQKLVDDEVRAVTDAFAFVDEALKIDHELLPVWATLNKIEVDLPTMRLRDFSDPGASDIPLVIMAPFAGHSATIADYSADQSLVRTLRGLGLHKIYVTDWKSATDEMRDFSIDTYLKDVDRIVERLGGHAHLIGLCQGGWMSAAYAARFPGKVSTLVLAGAPIDADAGDGPVKAMAHTFGIEFYRELVAAGNGRLLGKFMLAGWKSMNPTAQYFEKYVDLFEHIEDKAYLKRAEEFARWYETPLDLPGRYYLEAVEWIFIENRLPQNHFVALGKIVHLGDIKIPVYLLAGSDDDITPVKQVMNAQNYLGTPIVDIARKVAPGGHVGLFMGHENLKNIWPDIARWILGKEAAASSHAPAQIASVI